MKESFTGNKVYCPRCGRAIVQDLMGMFVSSCPRCSMRIKVIVNCDSYSVFGDLD